MTIQKDNDGILDLLICPGFCVKENIITQVNQAAAAMLLTPGTDVRTLLLTGFEEYAAFQGDSLYLKLNLQQEGWGAAVTRKGNADYFLLDQPAEDCALQALALAAKGLRETLSGALISADLLTQSADPANENVQDQLARLNRGLNRTLRLIGNMSDAGNWPNPNRQEIREIGSVFAEIFEKAQSVTEKAGIALTFTGLSKEIYTLADSEQLERAVLNILSNAMKFTPAGGSIQANLTLQGRRLQLRILDTGSGIPEEILGSAFTRYLRQPGLEDSRFGVGLGMRLIRSAASAHGGTVLVDRPEGFGTRITLTMAIRQDGGTTLRSPILLKQDYAGERDHVLLELSDCLPAELYK